MPKQDRKKKRPRGKQSQDWEALPALNQNAAGIDVGNTEHYVAVPAGRDAEPVQNFGSFTADWGPVPGELQNGRKNRPRPSRTIDDPAHNAIRSCNNVTELEPRSPSLR